MTVSLNKSQKLIYSLIKLNNGVSHKISLAKLQYFADFIHYAFTQTPISEETVIYARQEHGPLARQLSDDIDILKAKNLINESKDYKYTIQSNIEIDLTESELKTISYVLKKYGNSSWQDLKRISHEQIPYLSTQPGGIVELFTACNLKDEYEDYEAYTTDTL